MNDSLEVALLLIEKGAEVNAKNVDLLGRTPLHIAATNDSLKVARLLIENRVDVDVNNHGGETPLHYAAANNSLRVARLLIKHRAKVDAWSEEHRSPLKIAVHKNSLDVARLLIDSGAYAEDGDIDLIRMDDTASFRPKIDRHVRRTTRHGDDPRTLPPPK